MADESRRLGAALFPRPSQEELSVTRTHVGVACPDCDSTDIERYEVLRVTGWKRVTRCQSCLSVVASEDAPTPFGFTYLPYGSYLRMTGPGPQT
jgi:predicted RNA-binding Zn-ribbon protein involved in translation (DUF1610 family)